jgi:hypothetical protein
MLLQRCDTPLLLAATRCAIGLAEARGWSAATIAGVFYGLKAVLADRTGGALGPVVGGSRAGAATQPQLSHQDR